MRRAVLDFRPLLGGALASGVVVGILAFGWQQFAFGLMAVLAAVLVLKAASIALVVGVRLLL